MGASLLLRYAPYLAAVVLLLSIGGYAGYRANPWQARYHALQLADAQQRADGETAVRKELTEQLAQAQATSDNNANSMVKLANEQAAITADRDATVTRVRRLEQLLGAATTRTAASGSVPQSNRGSDPPDASGTAGLTEIERLLIDAKEESERNADRLDALVTQVTPQVAP